MLRLFRDPGAEGGAGTPTLTDILSGDGAPKLPNLEEQQQGTPGQQQQQAALAAVEGVNADGTLQDGYEKKEDGTVVKKAAAAAPAAEPVEGVNADGTLQEGYIKDATGKVVIDPAYERVPEGEEANLFWGEVDKVTGRPVKVEYPADVDPISPQGVALRISAEREDATLAFENYLKETKPRAYAFMLHMDNGGNEADFFSDNRGYVLPTEEELTASVDRQTEVYRHSLRARKLDDDSVEVLVQKAIKDNKLADVAKLAWKELDTDQRAQVTRLEQQQQQQEQEATRQMATFINKVTGITEKDMRFIVPEVKKQEFNKFLIDNFRYDNGKFYLVQEVADDGLPTTIESLFFQYMKGDLSSLIAKQVKKEAVHRLRLRLDNNNKTPGSGSDASKSATAHVPLGSIV